MTHLTKQEILAKVSSRRPLILNTPESTSEEFKESFQPDSYDLRIGPTAVNGRLEITEKQQLYWLRPGEKAIVLTKEDVDMPANLAAEVSPTNYLLKEGLLVIAPSHVDPGYKGPLTARVINLSNNDYPLKLGDRILTIRFYQLT